jgi:hypothetical protein
MVNLFKVLVSPYRKLPLTLKTAPEAAFDSKKLCTYTQEIGKKESRNRIYVEQLSEQFQR